MSWPEWLLIVIATSKQELAKLEAQVNTNGESLILEDADEANDVWDRFAATGN